MARPGACGLGRAWASNMTIVLRAGPGHTFCGPGSGLIIQFADRARAGSAQFLRARASNHICGAGLGPNFRPVQGPSTHLLFLVLAMMSILLGFVLSRMPSRNPRKQHTVLCCIHGTYL